jgi:hypothetical protein
MAKKRISICDRGHVEIVFREEIYCPLCLTLTRKKKLESMLRKTLDEIDLYRHIASYCKDPCFPTKGQA